VIGLSQMSREFVVSFRVFPVTLFVRVSSPLRKNSCFPSVASQLNAT
jgi:hypothetical protein